MPPYKRAHRRLETGHSRQDLELKSREIWAVKTI